MTLKGHITSSDFLEKDPMETDKKVYLIEFASVPNQMETKKVY